LYDTAGHLRGFAKVTQDLTERRHILDLEKAARNVSEFIAMLTHELRNPLAPIRTAIQVINHIPNVDPALDLMHRTIDRQSEHLAHILDDMMDVSRIARGKMTVEPKTIDLNEVIRRAVETARPSIEMGKHHLTMELPTKGLFVRGDFHRLAQLLTNLLNNAARYSEDGGLIFIDATTENGNGVVRVRDSGRGIAPENLDRIFNMFIQGREPNDKKGGGLGVGLALARNIAQLHNGSLDAYSEGEDKGSEFIFKIPLAESISENVQVPAVPSVAVQAGISRRILIVDDNIDAAESLSLLLKSLGHNTCVAYDGAGALKMASEFRPEIILLDLGMPGLDGYETARRLRTLNRGRIFQIIAVSGWGQEADRQKTREAGFDLHLVKPVNIDDLVQAVSREEKGSKRTLH
jgi:CheY-like chemotaxis protein/two-component sensor histidine kinase